MANDDRDDDAVDDDAVDDDDVVEEEYLKYPKSRPRVRLHRKTSRVTISGLHISDARAICTAAVLFNFSELNRWKTKSPSKLNEQWLNRRHKLLELLQKECDRCIAETFPKKEPVTDLKTLLRIRADERADERAEEAKFRAIMDGIIAEAIAEFEAANTLENCDGEEKSGQESGSQESGSQEAVD